MGYIHIDIDGTLIDSNENTTFKLLAEYLKIKRPMFWRVRMFILEKGLVLEAILSKLNLHIARIFSQLYLSLVIVGLNYPELYQFSEKFIENARKDEELIRFLQELSNTYVVTATIEPPAEVIRRMTYSEGKICTEFKVKGNRILYVKKRHITNTKIHDIIKRNLIPYVYIVDNPEVENAVAENSSMTIKHKCCKTTRKTIRKLLSLSQHPLYWDKQVNKSR